MAFSPLRILFPKQFRDLPHRRLILNLLRSAHIVCFSLLIGGLFHGLPEEQWQPWLIGTLLSGFGLFAVDLYGSFLALFEVRGVSVLFKLLLLSLLPLLGEPARIGGLIFIIVFSSMISHSTRRFRHRSLAPATFLHKYRPRDAWEDRDR